MFNVNPEDRINKVVKAIAYAEGCIYKDESYNRFSLPYRLNNPCGLKEAPEGFHGVYAISDNLSFQDIGIGWNAGYHWVLMASVSDSRIFNKNMMFKEIAVLYASEKHKSKQNTAAENWVKNVCEFLETTPDVLLDQYLNPIDVVLHGVETQLSPPIIRSETIIPDIPTPTTPAKTRLFGK